MRGARFCRDTLLRLDTLLGLTTLLGLEALVGLWTLFRPVPLIGLIALVWPAISRALLIRVAGFCFGSLPLVHVRSRPGELLRAFLLLAVEGPLVRPLTVLSFIGLTVLRLSVLRPTVLGLALVGLAVRTRPALRLATFRPLVRLPCRFAGWRSGWSDCCFYDCGLGLFWD